jgi:DNA mismatch repair protein MutS2
MQDKAPDFHGVTDIEPFVVLAEKDGILKLQDLVLIRLFVTASGRIMRFLKEHAQECPSLAEEYSKLDALEGITRELVKSITDNDELSETAFPELRRIRNELHSTRQEIEKKIGKLMHSQAMEHVLQEKIFSTRNERYVVLVKSNFKDRIKGTVHDISASGATYYIEPADITPLNNRVASLGKELQVETERALRALSKSVSQNAGGILNNLRIVSYLDFLTASSLFSVDIRGSEPEISDRCEINLIGARHPILYLMSPKTVVPNDIELGVKHNCLIISGANTGGKTVILKTIGLCALIAMLGLHIPAGPDSRIGIFSHILADIGDDQSLSQSLSTFSGQVVIIDRMLKEADEKTLVIIDEIVVGTNPRQGAALAQAIMETLIETGSKIVVTTHYSELKELPARDARFQNASVSFDLATLRPTYRLLAGLPGVSYAVEIAKNYGLPENIISRAHELLDSREISMESLVEMVQKYEQEMAGEKMRLAALSRELDLEKKQNEDRVKVLERRAQEIKQKEGIYFLNELAEYRRHVSEKIADLQQMNLKQAGAAQNRLMEIEQEIRSRLRKGKSELFADEYSPARPEALDPGSRVFVLSLEKEGTVERVDTDKKTATVLLGGFLKSTFSIDDLCVPAALSDATPAVSAKKQPGRKGADRDERSGIPQVVQTGYNTIDLRGKRVEEGIRVMEQDFDRMMRNGIDTVVVIHGHGTGAMKEAVRANLLNSLYAADSRPGETGEGGDGVTIVRLRT